MFKEVLSTFFIFFYISCFSQITAEKLNDSAISIYKQNPEKSLKILENALSAAQKDGNLEQAAVAKSYLGIVFRDLGDFEKAKTYSQQSLSIALDSLTIASAHNNIGACNRQLGLYEEALKSYLKALAIYETFNDEGKKATVTNNIGMVYSYLGMSGKAIDYHTQAKNSFEALNDKKGISQTYNNIAIIYANNGDLDQALNYFKYSLQIEKKLKDKKGIAESANNVGAVYYYQQEIDSALHYFKESAIIEKSIGNLAGVAASYNNIAQVLIENDRVAQSKKFIDSAYFFAQESKTAVDIEMALFNYSQYYEAKNNPKSALKFFKDYSKFKDSTLNIETKSKVAELEIEYQTEKKEKEILSQRTELAEKELNLNRKNTQLVGLGVLAVVLSLLGYLLYNQQKLKNKQLQKENELKEALVKIETQNRLQEQRLRISRDLHDNIGAQLTFIISSIENLQYGFKITNEKLTDKLLGISSFTKETISELRDTIWAMNKNAITLEDLQARISNFIDKANLYSNNIAFQFSIDAGVSKDFEFTSVKGMNIYRIIQEAVNNALKYAKPSLVEVRISQENGRVKFKVADDGTGFDLETVERGNGLNNMKKRAEEIGATFSVESQPNLGTQISLVC